MTKGLRPKQRAFLKAFAITANVRAAAKAAQVERAAHYQWVKDPAYKAAFDEAEEQASQSLEDEATRRAVEGVTQDEFYQGQKCGERRVYSDGLLMFLLRARNPRRFRSTGAIDIPGSQAGGGGTWEEFIQIYRRQADSPVD